MLNLIVLTFFSCKLEKGQVLQVIPPKESGEPFEFFKIGYSNPSK